MRINPLYRVNPVSMARLLPAILMLAMTPAVKAATGPIVFSGFEISPFGQHFSSATSVATDALGNLYVSEPTQNRVWKVTPAGTVTNLTGTFSTALNAPRGLAVDSSNNLWVANNGGSTIIRHPLGGGGDTTVGGIHGPINIAVDAANNLYVSSSVDNKVYKVTGGVVTVLVSSGLSQARGLAVDTADNLYISDMKAKQVVNVSASTGALRGYIVAAPNCSPRDVAVNAGGDLFVGCVNSSSVYRIPNEGGSLNLADKTRVSSSGIQNGSGIHGLAFDNTGTLFATSGTSVVDKIQLNSANLGSWLIGSSSATLATSATLHFSAIATVSIGVVTSYSEGLSAPGDPDDYRISKSGTNCHVQGGTFAAGTSCTVRIDFYPNAVGVRHGAVVFSDTGSPNNRSIYTLPIFGTGLGSRVAYGPGIPVDLAPVADGKGLSGPTAVCVDGIGNRYVADALNNRVVEFAQGTTTGVTVGTGLILPVGIAVDAAGSVYIADDHTGIQKVPNENGFLNSAHQTQVAEGLSLPTEIRFDEAQNLYIADTSNDRILKIPYEDGQLNPAHQKVIGSGFSQPYGVFAAPDGNVWVADTGNDRIVKVAPDGTQTTLQIDPNQIQGALSSPADVVLDQAGDVYISDSNNYRALYVSADGTVQAQIIKVPNPAGDYGGIWIDPVGQLYITDFFGEKVTLIGDLPFPLSFPNTQVGQTSATQAIQTSNIGNMPLNIEGLIFPLDFPHRDLSSPGDPVPDCTGTTTLAGGKSCLIGVVFQPTHVGSSNEQLQVVNTDFNTPFPFVTHVFPLSGTASSALTVAPASITFTSPVTLAATMPAAHPITIKNRTVSSTGLTLSLIGANAGDFAITTGPQHCGTILAGGASCKVYLQFKPANPASGNRTAQLQVATGVAGGGALITLNGNKHHPARISVTSTGKAGKQ